MSSRYTANGKRISSMTHAGRGEDCAICGDRQFGNGGKISHGRGHVRRSEAVEMVRFYDYGSPTRMFLDPHDPKVTELTGKGWEKIT